MILQIKIDGFDFLLAHVPLIDVYSSESIAWMTPFVVGTFGVTICDSFTFILPARGEERKKNNRLSVKETSYFQCVCLTSGDFLQRYSVASLKWVSHLIESHSRREQCAWWNVTHDKFMRCLFICHHEIDFLGCVISECGVCWCKYSIRSSTWWIWKKTNKQKIWNFWPPMKTRSFDKPLFCNNSESPDEKSARKKFVKRRSRSDCNVWRISPTGNGNITRSTACAMPCGIKMSCLSGKTMAPLIVVTCTEKAVLINS